LLPSLLADGNRRREGKEGPGLISPVRRGLTSIAAILRDERLWFEKRGERLLPFSSP
jgi:hypothetical protein